MLWLLVASLVVSVRSGLVYSPNDGFEGVDQVLLEITVPSTSESASTSVDVIVEAERRPSFHDVDRASDSLASTRLSAGGPERCILRQLRVGEESKAVLEFRASKGTVRVSPMAAASAGVAVVAQEDGVRLVGSGSRLTSFLRNCGLVYLPPRIAGPAQLTAKLEEGAELSFELTVDDADAPTLLGCFEEAGLGGIALSGGVDDSPPLRFGWQSAFGANLWFLPSDGITGGGAAASSGSVRAESPASLRAAIAKGGFIHGATRGDLITLWLSREEDGTDSSETVCALRHNGSSPEGDVNVVPSSARLAAPAGVVVTKDEATALRGISVTSAATEEELSLELSAGEGVLEIRGGPHGIGVRTLEGVGEWPPRSKELTLRGTAEALNAALQDLWFAPPLHYRGNTTLLLQMSSNNNNTLRGDQAFEVGVRVIGGDAPPRLVLGAGVDSEGVVHSMEDASLRMGAQTFAGVGATKEANRPTIISLLPEDSKEILLEIVDTSGRGSFFTPQPNTLTNVQAEQSQGRITLRGLSDDVAVALQNLEYQPQPDWHGMTRLDFSLDGSPPGASVRLVIEDVQDPPNLRFLLPDLTTEEDVSVKVVGIEVGDADVGQRLEVRLEARFGTLSVGGQLSKAALVEGPGAKLLLVSSSSEDMTEALNKLTYHPPQDFNGRDLITAFVSDGELGGSASLEVVVTPVNDAPLFTQQPFVKVRFLEGDNGAKSMLVTGLEVHDADEELLRVDLLLKGEGLLLAVQRVSNVTYSAEGYANNVTLTGMASNLNAALSLVTYVGDDDILLLKATDDAADSAELRIALTTDNSSSHAPPLLRSMMMAGGSSSFIGGVEDEVVEVGEQLQMTLADAGFGDAELELRCLARSVTELERHTIRTSSSRVRGAVHLLQVAYSNTTNVSDVAFKLRFDLSEVRHLPPGAATSGTTEWIALDALAKIDDERRGVEALTSSSSSGTSFDLTAQSVEAKLMALPNLRKAGLQVVVSRDDYADTNPHDQAVKLNPDQQPRSWRVTLTGATPEAANAALVVTEEFNSNTNVTVESRLVRQQNAVGGSFELLSVVAQNTSRARVEHNASATDVTRALHTLGMVARVTQEQDFMLAVGGSEWQVEMLLFMEHYPLELEVANTMLTGDDARVEINMVSSSSVGSSPWLLQLETSAGRETAVHALTLASGGPGFLKIGLDTRHCSLRLGSAAYAANGSLRWTRPVPRSAAADRNDERQGMTPDRNDNQDHLSEAYGEQGHSFVGASSARGFIGSSVESHLIELLNWADLGELAKLKVTRHDHRTSDTTRVTWRLTFQDAPHCLPLLRVLAWTPEDAAPEDRLEDDEEELLPNNSSLTRDQSLADRSARQSRVDSSGYAASQLEKVASPLSGSFRVAYAGKWTPELTVGVTSEDLAAALAPVLGSEEDRGARFVATRQGPDAAGGFVYHVGFTRLPLDLSGEAAWEVDGSKMRGPRSKRLAAGWMISSTREQHELRLGRDDVGLAYLMKNSGALLRVRGRGEDLTKAVLGLALNPPERDHYGQVALDFQLSNNQEISTAFFDFDLKAVNDAPYLLWSGERLGVEGLEAVSTTEDAPVRVGGLRAADVDATPGELHTLSFEGGLKGRLRLRGNVSEGPLRGSLKWINAALATMEYQPRADWHGVDLLKLRLTDGHNASSSSTELRLVVAPVNDFPVWTIETTDDEQETGTRPAGHAPTAGWGQVVSEEEEGAVVATRVIEEDVTTILGGIVVTDADVDSPDAAEWIREAAFSWDVEWSAHFQLELSVDHGLLQLRSGVGTTGLAAVLAGGAGNVEIVEGDASRGSRRLVMRGHADATRRVLESLAYTSDEDWSGMDLLSLTVRDGGDAAIGAGGSRESRAFLALQVDPVVDNPVLLKPTTGTATFEEDRVVVFGRKEAVASKKMHQVVDEPFSVSDADVRGDVKERWLLPWTFADARQPNSQAKLGTYVVLPGLLEEAAQRFNVTIQARHGTLLLVQHTGSTGPTRSVHVSNASLSELNLALFGLEYRPDLNWNSEAEAKRLSETGSSDTTAMERLDFDLADSAGGASKSSFEFFVAAVNDAPVLDAASVVRLPDQAEADGQTRKRADGGVTLRCLEDGSELSLGASLRDVDASELRAHGALLDVTLVATHGSLGGDKVVSFSASVDEASEMLAKLHYAPAADYAGADTVLISVSDRGNSGTGGALSDSLLVPIAVDAACDAPRAAPLKMAYRTLEDEAIIVGFALQDADHANLASRAAEREDEMTESAHFPLLRVSISASNGFLTFDSRGALDFEQGTGVSDSAVTFTGTLKAANAALASITYAPRRDFFTSPEEPYELIELIVDDLGLDGGGLVEGEEQEAVAASCPPLAGRADLRIVVDAVNDPPVVRVPGSVYRSTGLRGTRATEAALRGDLELVRVKPSIVDEDAILELGESVTLYEDSADDLEALGALSIVVSADAEYAFATQGSMVELEGGEGPLEAALFTTDEEATSPWRRSPGRWLVRPREAQLLLSGLRFRGVADFHGNASISVAYEDGGYGGLSKATGVPGCDWCSLAPVSKAAASPSLFDAKTIPVTIMPVRDAPYFVSMGVTTIAAPEDRSVYIDSVSVVDPDDDEAVMRLRLSVEQGTVSLAEPPPERLDFLIGDGRTDVLIVCEGPLSAVNRALAGLRYVPAADLGQVYDAIRLEVTDDTGLTATLKMPVLVAASRTSNDAPQITLPNATRFANACESSEGARSTLNSEQHLRRPVCADRVSVVTLKGFTEDVPRQGAFADIKFSDAESIIYSESSAPFLEVHLSLAEGLLFFGEDGTGALALPGLAIIEEQGLLMRRQWRLRGPLKRLEAAVQSMRYLGARDFYGVDVLNVTLVDSHDHADLATLILIVEPANDAPTLQVEEAEEWVDEAVEYLEVREDSKLRLPTVRVVDPDNANDNHHFSAAKARGNGAYVADALAAALLETVATETTLVRLNVSCNSGRILLCATGCPGVSFITAVADAEESRKLGVPVQYAMRDRPPTTGADITESSGRPPQRWWRTAVLEGSAAALTNALWDWHYWPIENFNSERHGSEDDLLLLQVGEMQMSTRLRVLAVNDAPVVRAARLEQEDPTRPTGDGLSLRPRGAARSLVTDEDEQLDIGDVFTVRDVDSHEGLVLDLEEHEEGGILLIIVECEHGEVSFRVREDEDLLGRLAGIVPLWPASSAVTTSVRCSAEDANLLLARMIFTPDRDWHGENARVRVVADDLGRFGYGGPLRGSQSVRVKVRSRNDAPTLTAPEPLSSLDIDERGAEGRLLRGAAAEDASWAHESLDPTHESRPPLGEASSEKKSRHGGFELWRSRPGRSETTRDVDVEMMYYTSSEGDSEQRGFRHAEVGLAASQPVLPRNPRELVVFKDRLWFAASDDDDTASFGEELWSSDGRSSELVVDLMPGVGSSMPRHLTVYNGRLYFAARGVDDGSWRVPLDHRDDDDCAAARKSSFAPKASFVVSESTEWMPGFEYDCPLGSRWASTQEAEALFTGRNRGASTGDAQLNDHSLLDDDVSHQAARGSREPKTYYGECGWVGYDWGGARREHFRFSDSHLTGAYKSAGSPDSLRPQFDSSRKKKQFSSSLLRREGFAGIVCLEEEDEEQSHGVELWTSDGTAEGTVRALLDLDVGVPSDMAVFQGALYFAGDHAVHGRELFRFVSEDDEHGRGRATLVADLRPGFASSRPTELTVCGSRLWFAANDGHSGRELYLSDGEEAAIASDVAAGPSSSEPLHLACLQRGSSDDDGEEPVLLFSAQEPSRGRELWRGTPRSNASTAEALVSRVRDIHRGRGDSNPRYMMPTQGSTSYFAADDGEHGLELWRTDGSASGTSLVADIRPGAASSRPAFMVELGGLVYFVAQASDHGTVSTASSSSALHEPSQLFQLEGDEDVRGVFWGEMETQATLDLDRATMDLSRRPALVPMGEILYYPAKRGDFWQASLGSGSVRRGRGARAYDKPQAFAVYDVDGPRTELLTLSLTAEPEGSLSFSLVEEQELAISRLTLVEGDGVEDKVLTLRGTAVDLNAAMRALAVRAPKRYAGEARVLATLFDDAIVCLENNSTVNETTCARGNSSLTTRTAYARVLVRRVNEQPTIVANAGPHAVTTAGTSTLTIEGPALLISDPDLDDEAAVGSRRDVRTGLLIPPSLSLTLEATYGTLSLGALSDALTFLEGDGVSDRRIQLFAPLDALNEAVETLRYDCLNNCSLGALTDLVTATIDDGGFSGAGGPLQAQTTLNISIPASVVDDDDDDATE